MDIGKLVAALPKWIFVFLAVIVSCVIVYAMAFADCRINLFGLSFGKDKACADKVTVSDVPVGTIIAWHRDLLVGPSGLPDAWAECNGQRLDDPSSLLHGEIIPNLNGERQFIRGGAKSGISEKQDWKSFYARGSGPCPYTHEPVLIPKEGYNTAFPFGGGWHSDGSPPKANCLGFMFDDSEVRPANMSAVWIMKVR